MITPRLLPVLLAAPLLTHAQTALPDFSLPDVNTSSRRRGITAQPVSPRNYLHQATAWYFGDEG